MTRNLSHLDTLREMIQAEEDRYRGDPPTGEDPVVLEARNRVMMTFGQRSDPDSITQENVGQAFAKRMMGGRTMSAQDRSLVVPSERHQTLSISHHRVPRLGGRFQIKRDE